MAMLAMTGCTSGNEESVIGTGDQYLHISFVKADTRADIANDGSGNFEDGDEIGLYIDNGERVEYRRLTYAAGEWQPRLQRSDFGDGRLTLSAHFPASDGLCTDTPAQTGFKISTDQSVADANTSDLLFSSATLEAGAFNATMTFRHAMHRLRITLSGRTEGVEISVRSLTEGTVNLLSGESFASAGTYGWITPRINDDGSLEAVIIPQSAEPYRDDEGLLKISFDGKESRFKAPETTAGGESLTEFLSGKQTTVNLSIREDEVKPDLANQVLWVYGVDAPAFPGKENVTTYPPYAEVFPEGEWMRFDYTFSEAQRLTWAEGCGWYDCNKSDGYVEGDGHMCWAASASNLLIWWMVQNKAYIEAYDREYGSSVQSTVNGQVFERPAPDFKPLYATDGSVNRAPVFEFFKSTFPDQASWTSGGVNWFVNGDDKNLVTPNVKGFPGFFSEVFKRTDTISFESQRSPNREQFNEIMVDALLNRKAIGFDIYGYTDGTSLNHAMVIWGAEFDESGYISHIYYCENNWADQDVNGASIIRAKIVYLEDDSIPELGTREYTYMTGLDNEDGVPTSKYKISVLHLVDLRTDIWKQKYPSVVNE